MQEPIREEPFFVRFLEGQDYPEAQTDLRGGKAPPLEQTMKAPSDNDEW